MSEETAGTRRTRRRTSKPGPAKPEAGMDSTLPASEDAAGPPSTGDAADAAAEALETVAVSGSGPVAVAIGVAPDGGVDTAAGAAARTILRVRQGGLSQVAADEVQIRLGGIGALEAERVEVALGGIGAARADVIDVRLGSVGAALAGDLRVTQGAAGSVIAREAHVEQAFVRTLIARDVEISRPSAVLLLLAGRVRGDVRPLLDWRGALAVGLGFGLVAGVLGLAARKR